jgi:hypothetical protein
MSEIPRTQNRSAIEFDVLFEPLLDSDEAAQLLKIHPKTLQRLAQPCSLPKKRNPDSFQERLNRGWSKSTNGRRS